MLGIVIFFTAFISTLFTANGSKDLESILSSLQSYNINIESSDDSSSSDSSDDVRNIVDQLRNMDLGNLVQVANQLKVKSNEDQRQALWYPPYSGQRYRINDNQNEPERHERGHYGLKDQILQHLVQKESKPLKTFTHKRLTPNTLLNPLKQNDDVREQTSSLNEYSKIFVILDPGTLKNSANNKGAVSNLLSRILSQTSAAAENARQNRNLNNYYKGFVVKDNIKSRRYRRESKEMYGGGGGGGGGGSMEDDYRPKRPRNDHGGGGGGVGGGGGGRTAIPYIRHRGDIYERDH